MRLILILLLSSMTLFGQFYNGFKVNKFGYAPSGVQSTQTDIWDLANATPTQSVWLAPADSAQTHKIVSSSTADSGAQGGAVSVRVYGLTSWSTVETYEDVTLEGTDSVETSKEYVIIHRMKVLSSGTSDSINVGQIRAIASGSLTVTAVISIGFGQTEMAIYGVPSGFKAVITHWYADLMKASGAAAHVQMRLLVNENPDTDEKDFIVKSVRGVQSTGSNWGSWQNNPGMTFNGPCIIKVAGIGSANDLDTSAGFDLVLVKN